MASPSAVLGRQVWVGSSTSSYVVAIQVLMRLSSAACRGLVQLLPILVLLMQLVVSEGYVPSPPQLNYKYHSTGRDKQQVACTAAAARGGHESTVVLLYNKPANVITSHSSADLAPEADANGRVTVYQDVMSMVGYVPIDGNNISGHQIRSLSFEEATGIHSKLHAVGRLDADTTGILLLTNDGGLVHAVTTNAKISTSGGAAGDDSPLVTKTYEALIMGHHEMESSAALQQILNDGVDLGAKVGRAEPAIDLQVLSHPTAKSTLVELTIAEGKNRQVRRTLAGIRFDRCHSKRRREYTPNCMPLDDWMLTLLEYCC